MARWSHLVRVAAGVLFRPRVSADPLTCTAQLGSDASCARPPSTSNGTPVPSAH